MRKYRNTPVTVAGQFFASKAEAKRYTELVLLQRAGQIHNLQCQPRFPLFVNETLIATYVGDFFYYEKGKPVWEEVKGFETREWKLKRKLFEALNSSELRVISSGKRSSVKRASPRTATARKRSAGSTATSRTCSETASEASPHPAPIRRSA